jgi:hypothetical protein
VQDEVQNSHETTSHRAKKGTHEKEWKARQGCITLIFMINEKVKGRMMKQFACK